MKRKVNLVGQNTLTVSLPTKWAQEHNLKKGDEIELVTDSNNNIVLSREAVNNNTLKEVRLTIFHNDKIHIRSLLGSVYRKGYDKVYLTFDDPTVYKMVVDAANSLIGYEVIDFERNKCVIKNMVLEESSEFESTLRRIITSLKWMNTLIMDDIASKKFENLEELSNMRTNIWRLRDYAMRIITKKNLFKCENLSYSIIVWTLEKIVDQYRKMYEVILKDKNKNYASFMSILQRYAVFIDVFEKAYYKKDISLMPKFDELYTEINKKCADSFNSNKHNNLFIAYILENSKRLHDLKSFLVMIILDVQENIVDGTK